MTRPPAGNDPTGPARGPRFRDGLGTRQRAADAGGDPVEHLHLVPELTAQESAIRERVGRLINFRHARYVRLRGVERARSGARELIVAYDALDGVRLSTVLETLPSLRITFDVDIAMQIVRDLLPAIGILHDSRKVTHGAIAPERLVFTHQQQRLVIVDHGFGTALGRLNLPRKKLWDQFRIAVPGANRGVFDERTDVLQIGLVALALLLARPLQDDEYPGTLKRLVFTLKEVSSRVGPRPIGPELRRWLERALGVDEEQVFTTVKEAQDAFEAVIATGRYAPSAGVVKAFFLRYQELAPAPAEAVEAPLDGPKLGAAVEFKPPVASARPAEAAKAKGRAGAQVDALKTLEEELSRLSADVVHHSESATSAQVLEATEAELEAQAQPVVLPVRPVEVSAFERTANDIYADAEASRNAQARAERRADASDERAAQAVQGLELAERAARDAGAREQVERGAREAAEQQAKDAHARMTRETAEREAAEQAARDAAARESVERQARERAEQQARAAAERAEREQRAREQAEKAAAEQAARLEAERDAAAKAARAEAERVAAEQAAQLLAEREAVERKAREEAVRHEAERAAAERRAREDAAREAASREQAEREARERAEREAQRAAERAAREQAAREAAERLAAEQAARLEAEREAAARAAAEHAARLQAERDAAARLAAEEAARLRAERDAAERNARESAARAKREQAAREQAEREAAEHAARLQAEREAAARAKAEEAARLQAEREEAQRQAAARAAEEAATKAAAEREARERAEQQARAAAEQAAREAAERESAEREARKAAERARREAADRELAERAAMEAASRASREAADRVAAEKQARELAARAEAERLARASAEREAKEAAERAAREAAEREAAQQAAREAAARADQERQAREAAERAARDAGARADAERQARAEAEARARAAAEQALRDAAQAARQAEEAARSAARQVELERQARAAAEARAQQAAEQAAREQAEREALLAQQITRETINPAPAIVEPKRRRRAQRRNPLADTKSLTPNPAILPEPAATVTPAAPAADEPHLVEWAPSLVVEAVPAWARGGSADATPEPPAEFVAFVAPPVMQDAAGLERYTITPPPAPAVPAPSATIVPMPAATPTSPSGPTSLGSDASAADERPAAPVIPFRPRPRFEINWARTLAASLLVALLEGVAFAAAWWFVTPNEQGWLIVHTRPTGIQVAVDGRQLGPTPLATALSPGRHTIELRHGTATRVMPVEISPGVQTEQRIAWGKGFRTGQAKISTTTEGARVLIDGRERGRTPLTVTELAAGRHEVTVDTDKGSVSATLIVEAGETTELDVPVFSGWVSILSPVDLDILLDGRLLGTTAVEKLMLAPGRHKLELRNESLGYREVQEVQVRPGATTSVSVLPRVSISVEGPEGAELWVDGDRLGALPLAKVDVPIGTREFVLRREGEDERRQVVVITMTTPVVLKY